MFAQKNGHLQEVHNIKTALIYVYLRNGGSISRNYIAVLIWDVVIDAVHYFYTFPTENDFATNYNLPQTRLYCRRSILSVNIYVHPMDTPGKWLNHNSQWKPGRVGTKPNNYLNIPYNIRGVNQPRYK